MARDYRSFLRALGRKPIRGQIRTKREPGELECMWDPKAGEHRWVTVDEEQAA